MERTVSVLCSGLRFIPEPSAWWGIYVGQQNAQDTPIFSFLQLQCPTISLFLCLHLDTLESAPSPAQPAPLLRSVHT